MVCQVACQSLICQGRSSSHSSESRSKSKSTNKETKTTTRVKKAIVVKDHEEEEEDDDDDDREGRKSRKKRKKRKLPYVWSVCMYLTSSVSTGSNWRTGHRSNCIIYRPCAHLVSLQKSGVFGTYGMCIRPAPWRAIVGEEKRYCQVTTSPSRYLKQLSLYN